MLINDMGGHVAATITTTTPIAAPPTTAASPCSWGGNREHWQVDHKHCNHGRAAGAPHLQGVYGACDDNDEWDDRTTMSV